MASQIAAKNQNKNWTPDDRTPFTLDRINKASANTCNIKKILDFVGKFEVFFITEKLTYEIKRETDARVSTF